MRMQEVNTESGGVGGAMQAVGTPNYENKFVHKMDEDPDKRRILERK